MPPVTRITKDDVLEAAYDIVRIEGFSGLNARKLAKKLNCSVQPIFHKFANMEDLKKDIVKKALSVYRQYILKQYDENCNAYKNMGIGYIKFAKEETKLFQIIFMEEHNLSINEFMELDNVYEDIINCLKDILGFEDKRIVEFHSKIWLFTHGIATMIATHTCKFTGEQINDMLTDIYMALKAQEDQKEEEYENGKNN